MANRSKRHFHSRSLNRKFIIVTEGEVTEPGYFELFREAVLKNADSISLTIRGKRRHEDSNPNRLIVVTDSMVQRLKKPLSSKDEVWIVFDRDKWTEDQLKEVETWSNSKSYRYYAVSCPKFEYWLLLHCPGETARSFSSSDCDKRFESYFPKYNKTVPSSLVTLDNVSRAVKIAKQQSQNSSALSPVGTTVYKLVEHLCEDAGVSLT